MVQINTIIISFDAFLRRFYLHQMLLPTIITRIEIDSHWTQNTPSRHNTGNKNRLCTVTISFMSLQIIFFFEVRACIMKTPLIKLTAKSFICLSLVYFGFSVLISFATKWISVKLALIDFQNWYINWYSERS